MVEEIVRGEEIIFESYLFFKGYVDVFEELIFQLGELVKVVFYSVKDGIIVMVVVDSEWVDIFFEEECLWFLQEEIDVKFVELGIVSELVVEVFIEEVEFEVIDVGLDELV